VASDRLGAKAGGLTRLERGPRPCEMSRWRRARRSKVSRGPKCASPTGEAMVAPPPIPRNAPAVKN
jgi:hypothetical protein